MIDDDQLYALVGEDGFRRLVAAFYAQVPTDDILGPMYPPEDLLAAEERLRDFLIGRFGGPPRYIQQRGHPRLRMRHAPFPINDTARNRWMQLMDRALKATKLPADADEALRAFFEDVSRMLINRL